jgi:hypothetical protein
LVKVNLARVSAVAPRVIARVEAGPQGADSRFIVTNLAGLPKALYERVYCARGQAENLIKAPSCTSPPTAPLHQGNGQPVPAADPHRRLLVDVEPARAGAPDIVLGRRSVRYDPPLPDQGGRSRHLDGHPHQDRPADRLPYQIAFATFVGRIAKLPP